MGRKKLIRSSEFVYHITSRSNNKEWFFLPSHEVWRICIDLLDEGSKKFGVEIHAFVLMSNHYHLMIRTPNSDIDKFMKFFNGKLSRLINMSAGRINHVFGGPYKWSLIDNNCYYMNAIKYLYQNPLRGNICKRVEDYPYSTARKSKYSFKIYYQLSKEHLDWINELFTEKKTILIRKGFRRDYFHPGC